MTLNCIDVASLGVITTGTAQEAWDLIQSEWGKSTNMRRSHAQEALNRTTYVEGTDIREHIKLLRTRKAAVDNLTTSSMSDETWQGIIIRSIPPTNKWLPVIPSLYSLASSADIILTLSAHGMILDSHKSVNSSNTALAACTAEGCTNPNCKAKKQTTHTTPNCYWPGGGKEVQFPPNSGQRSKANTANSTLAAANTTTANSTTTNLTTEHFALSVRILNTPGQSGVLINDGPINSPTKAFISKAFLSFDKGSIPTFMDSGASDTMFVSQEVFSDYKPIESHVGDSAKAKNGGFEIIGEGTVTQTYRVDGRDKCITYTRALHTPTLNANLVSISALDNAGLTVTFGQGKGEARKPDGTVVLAGKNMNGMYLLDPVDSLPNTTLAMKSQSQSISLEQWHR